MRGRVIRICCFVIVLSWVCVTSRLFAPNHDGHHVPQPGTEQSPQSLQVTLHSKESNERSSGLNVGKMKEKEAVSNVVNEGENRIGSSPPSCDHKCYGCMPCQPIQVPTTTSRVAVQFANYQPESWKCKCGPAFYTP